MGTVFGPTVSGREVERRVEATLRYWFETYLQDREIETQRVRGSVARPRTYKVVNEFDDKNPEDQTPFISLVSSGLVGPPRNSGKGSVMATWSIGVGVVIEASTEQASQDILKDIYCPVIVKILLQKRGLNDWSQPGSTSWTNGLDWVDMGYDSVAFGNEERSLWMATLLFEVTVDNVLNRLTGPTTPADPVIQPGTDWPYADSGSIEFKELTLDA